MTRLRYNGLSATLGGSGLTSSATSVTFAAALTHSGGLSVPTITGADYIPLTILDAAGRVSEVVYLTTYTSGATTGTITRGQEGTTGVAHSSGDKVTHGPTVQDFTFPKCRVYRSVDFSLPASTVTIIPFDAETYDANGMHDTATNPSRVVIPSSGDYLVSAFLQHNADIGGVQTRILRNGTLTLLASQGSINGGENPALVDVLECAAGDYIEVAAYQSTGSGKTVFGGAVNATFLTVKKLP